MVHIKTRIDRTPSRLVEGFAKMGAATVHEASGRKGAVDPAVTPIRRGLRLCGSAFTVQCAPGDNLMAHKALEKALPGDVLVASVGGYPEGGYFGGLMAVSAVARDEADAVLERALQRVEAEAKKAAQLRSGVSSVELNKLGKVFEALGLIEE